jgi:hypothetical protein
MPCALEMLMLVWWPASIWDRLSALRQSEAAKRRGAVLNISHGCEACNVIKSKRRLST